MQSVMNILNNVKSGNYKYVGTNVEEWNKAPIQTKGAIGENVAEAILVEDGNLVGPRMNSTHDRVINGQMVEIKTAFEAADSNLFAFYGYNATEDPHYWLVVLVQPDETITLVKLTRQDAAKFRCWGSKGNTVIAAGFDEFCANGTVISQIKL